LSIRGARAGEQKINADASCKGKKRDCGKKKKPKRGNRVGEKTDPDRGGYQMNGRQVEKKGNKTRGWIGGILGRAANLPVSMGSGNKTATKKKLAKPDKEWVEWD